MGVCQRLALMMSEAAPVMVLVLVSVFLTFHLVPSLWNKILRATCAHFIDKKRNGRNTLWETAAQFPLGHLDQLRDDPLGFARRELEGSEDRRATCFWMFHKPIMWVTDPNLAKELLSPAVTTEQTYRDIGARLPVWDRLYGKSLFMVCGEQWKRQHRIALRSFGSGTIDRFLPTIVSVSSSFAEGLLQADGNASPASGGVATIEPAVAFDALALEAICSTAFGLSDNPKLLLRISRLFGTIFSVIKDQGVRMLIPGYLHLPTPANRTIVTAIDELHEISRSLVRRHRESPEDADNGDACFLASLADAMDQGEQLSDLEVQHNVFAFMAAGMDTTATTLGHLVCCLASHPDVQARLASELSKHDTVKSKLEHCAYLTAVIKEVMRLFPASVTTGPRIARDDMEVDGLVLRKGDTAVVASIAIQRSHAVWGPDAECFNPDRHLAKPSRQSFANGDYDFTTFGGGVRSCIGRHFALMELKVATAMLVERYRFEHTASTTLGPHREHPCFAPMPQLQVQPGLRVEVHVRPDRI
eukprot:m.34982 g.34982  ORF g.34982 m.34982 type:complete len:530 (-) comp7396_c0_seq1:132-1721(-)